MHRCFHRSTFAKDEMHLNTNGAREHHHVRQPEPPHPQRPCIKHQNASLHHIRYVLCLEDPIRKSWNHTKTKTAFRPMSGCGLNSLSNVGQSNPANVKIITCMPQHILSTTCPRAAMRILRRTAHHNTLESLKDRARSNSRRSTGTPSRGTDSCWASSQLFWRVDSGARRSSVSHRGNASI